MKQGWLTKKLADVCEVEYGTRVVRKRDGGTTYPVYGGGGATFFMDIFNREDCFIVARFAMSQQCTRFVEGKFFLNDSGLSVKPKDTKEILQDFLNLQILYLNDYIYSLGKGTAQKNLDVPAFRNMEINYPESLSEQKRIVATLDEAFGSISKAKVIAEQNLKNAKQLFESYLQSVFESSNDNWVTKTLGDVYDVRDGTHDSPKYQNEGFPLVTSKNLKNDLLNYNNVSYISETDYTNINKRSKVDVGDILFAMIGTIGNPVVIKDEPDFAIKNVALFKVPKEQDSLFLKYYLDAKSTVDKMMHDAKGTTQKFVGLGYLRGFKILLPPLSEQRHIVKKLYVLSEKTKKLEAIYQQKLKDLDELKTSIMNKVFDGELKADKVLV